MNVRRREPVRWLMLATLILLGSWVAGCNHGHKVAVTPSHAQATPPAAAASTHATARAGAPTLVYIAVSPSDPVIPNGGRQQLTAVGRFSDGTTRKLSNVTWSSKAAGVARVDANGLVTAGSGRLQIKATLGKVTGSARLRVLRAGASTLTNLVILPARALSAPGTTRRYRAVGTFGDGSHADVTSEVSWSSSNESVATIDNKDEGPHIPGQATVVGRPGQTVRIRASWPGRAFGSVSATLHVGLFAYTANSGSNSISGFVVDPATGKLKPTDPASFAAGDTPDSIAVDPSGRFLYVTNRDANTVSGFVIDPITGALTPTNPPSFATGKTPFSVAVDPGDRFLYVTSMGGDSVSGFSIDPATGALTPTRPTSFATGNWPWSIAVSPGCHFAYVANERDDTVSAFAIDRSSGALTPARTPTIDAGSSPWSVTAGPHGHFVYVTDRGGDSLSVFHVDADSGKLTPTANCATGSRPLSATVVPSGHFVYVANNGARSLSCLVAPPGTGRLISAGPAVATPGGKPVSVVAGPNGRYLYAVGGSHEVWGFTIDRRRGHLTAMSPPTVATGRDPLSMVVTP